MTFYKRNGQVFACRDALEAANALINEAKERLALITQQLEPAKNYARHCLEVCPRQRQIEIDGKTERKYMSTVYSCRM